MEVKSMVLLLLAVVPMCSAQKKCCFPDQFEALESQTIGSVVSGKGAILYQITQVAFDYTNKREGGLVTAYNMGQVQNYQIILDFKKGVVYTFYEKLRICQKFPLPGSMTHCIPSSATYEGSTYYGDKKVTTDDFKFYMSEAGTTGNVTFAVTKGDCIPFGVIVIETQNGVSTLVSEGFTNYTSGIKDPSKYFTVPSYCPQLFSEEARIDNTFPGFFFF